VRVGNSATDCQPETRTTRFRGEKRVKNVSRDLLGYAWPRVGNFDHNPRLPLGMFAVDAHCYNAIGTHRFDGIEEQVEEELL
jgi:hypothetical protein